MTPDVNIPRSPSPLPSIVILDDEDDEVAEVVYHKSKDGDRADASTE